jgi:hypothetical protein
MNTVLGEEASQFFEKSSHKTLIISVIANLTVESYDK